MATAADIGTIRGLVGTCERGTSPATESEVALDDVRSVVALAEAPDGRTLDLGLLRLSKRTSAPGQRLVEVHAIVVHDDWPGWASARRSSRSSDTRPQRAVPKTPV